MKRILATGILLVLAAALGGCGRAPDAPAFKLTEMAQAVRELGPDGDQMQVLFVTVDPERDTAKVLRQYVPSFHHTAGTYLYDREGRLRLFAQYGQGAAAMLHDIRILLAS